MKLSKKILSVFLAVLMLSGLAAAGGQSALAQESASVSAGDTIEFGTYPQSAVEATEALEEAAANATWKSYGYYSGTGSYFDGKMSAGDYMQFADFLLDGVKYRAVFFTKYRPYVTGFACAEPTSYVYANGYRTGVCYYFKYEPIEWRVIDADNGIVVCTKHIDSQAFSNCMKLSGPEMYGADGEHYANDYAFSSIKAWLNDDFYNASFTGTQKSNITADENLGSVYIFSKEESRANGSLTFAATDYAKCQGLHSYDSYGYYRWTRSAGCTSEFAVTVSDSGNYRDADATNYTCVGVCPVIKLSEIKEDVNVSCYMPSAQQDVHIPGKFESAGESGHKTNCTSCGDEITLPHNWAYPKWNWTDPENPQYSTSCPDCGAEKSGAADRAWNEPHEATVESYAYTNYYAEVTLGTKKCNGIFCRIYEGSMLAAQQEAFDGYKDEKSQEAQALALEGDGLLCAEAIKKAQEQLDALVYDEDKSYEENKAAADEILTALAEKLEEIRSSYLAVFVVDGTPIAEVAYTAETVSIEAPAVPEKEGFTGSWEEYTLVPGGVTVNAVYTPVEPGTPDTPENACPLDGLVHGTDLKGRIISFVHSLFYNICKALGMEVYLKITVNN